MMEGVLSQRMSPLLKCILLFLFIFTAKVLTSRPHDTQDSRNEIQYSKPAHYVRTFTKYHHRRTIQWNNLDPSNWPVTVDQPKVIGKRSVDVLNTDDLLDSDVVDSTSSNYMPDSDMSKIIDFDKKSLSLKDLSHNEVEDYKVKAVPPVTKASPPATPSITCLYKIHSVAMSETSSIHAKYLEATDQLTVENEIFDSGEVLKETLPSGEVVEVQQCVDPRAYCYTLFHQEHDGNVTVLGQGCWYSSQAGAGAGACERCARVARLPDIKFCCCTTSYCNADASTLKEETVTIKAQSTMEAGGGAPSYASIAAAGALAAAALLLAGAAARRLYCRRDDVHKGDMSDCTDAEKGDVMGSGPDALATGLLCVDNLTLIEHIGQGRFGSVWRGSLGGAPVAVKLYANAGAWHKEASIYSLPHLAHPNILKYYGSDTRSPLTGGGAREHLLVLELCAGTLRARLQRAPLGWLEFATLAHGVAAALAHLHTPVGGKPCVVHRDVNSSNVLVCWGGRARLADLGLAQCVPHRPQRPHQPHQPHHAHAPHAPPAAHAPARYSEAGTLRYLSPEALEGALDLSGARAALCAVDVFALALVLWEMLWRCAPAHPRGRAPPYAPPYHHHGLPARPTLAQMQSLVSRNKARPPLPKGPVPEARALKIASDTCDECWDHDAEARLTAVCVEERMAELKMMLLVQGPVIHDNNLHPHPPAEANGLSPPPAEADKNSNCISTQNGDVTTPLLYPQPHIGRNACIERNTHTNTQTHTVELIHKSLKDITAPAEVPRAQNVEENCLSVARISHNRIQAQENSDRFNEIRSYQRPLDYVQNDVSCHDVDRLPKQTNILQDVKVEKPKWGIRKFFERRLGRAARETEVKLVPECSNSVQNGRTMTSIVDKPSNVTFDAARPANLVLNQDSGTYNFEPCTLSPPNRTLSPTMVMESEMNTDKVFKELPSDDSKHQIFAVIVPKVIPADLNRSKTSGSTESINKRSVRTSMSSQSIFKAGHSESEDSTVKKRLSCDNRIISNSSNSGRSSRASINLELQYIDNNQTENFNGNDSPFDLNSDCSSSEDENLMLLSENGGSKITMQTIPKNTESDKRKNEVLKEASQAKTDFGFNKFHNKYTNFDNEFSDPNDKENVVNGYSGDNPVYLAALNGEIDTADLKLPNESTSKAKPPLKSLAIKRQHSLEQVSEIFTSAGDLHLQNPAGRVKTPGDLPVAVRRARRDRALQKGRASECNRLSLYDDRMMFGNSL